MQCTHTHKPTHIHLKTTMQCIQTHIQHNTYQHNHNNAYTETTIHISEPFSGHNMIYPEHVVGLFGRTTIGTSFGGPAAEPRDLCCNCPDPICCTPDMQCHCPAISGKTQHAGRESVPVAKQSAWRVTHLGHHLRCLAMPGGHRPGTEVSDMSWRNSDIVSLYIQCGKEDHKILSVVSDCYALTGVDWPSIINPH